MFKLTLLFVCETNTVALFFTFSKVKIIVIVSISFKHETKILTYVCRCCN